VTLGLKLAPLLWVGAIDTLGRPALCAAAHLLFARIKRGQP